jgi:lipoprotein NlpI
MITLITQLNSRGVPDQEENTIKMADRTAEELCNLGEIYLSSANYKLANLHFTAALSKKPDFADAYIGLGKTLLHTADHQYAAQAFLKALEIDPANTSASVVVNKDVAFVASS